MRGSEKASNLWSERYLGMAALSLLLFGAVYVLTPFMTALMWSVILGFSLWPAQRLLTKWFGGRRTLASVVLALLVSVLLVGPIVLLGVGLADDAALLGTTTKKWVESASEKPPEWTKRVPVVGDSIEEYWVAFHETKTKWMEQINKGMEEAPPLKEVVVDDEKVNVSAAGESIVRELNKPSVDKEEEGEDKPIFDEGRVFELVGKILAWSQTWLLGATVGLLKGVFQIVLSVVLTFFILRDGEVIGARVAVAAQRIAGARGQYLIKVAGSTVRGVVYGIIGTAVAQGILAGLGLGLAGVPAAALLGVLTFFLSAVPVGPPMVWIPATIWLFSTGKPGWAVFMLLWGIFVVSGVDNIIKPYLISHGAKIPFVVVFLGVIGGALAFGLVGVFLGPTLLAVIFRIVEEWSSVQTLLVKDLPSEDAKEV